MRTIWKFPVKMPLEDNLFSVEMPEGAQVLTIQTQARLAQMWALVDPASPLEERFFRLYGTGHHINAEMGCYVGSFQLAEGALIFHIFEEVSVSQVEYPPMGDGLAQELAAARKLKGDEQPEL